MIKVFEWVHQYSSGTERNRWLDLDEVAYCEHIPDNINSCIVLRCGLQITIKSKECERFLTCLSEWKNMAQANHDQASNNTTPQPKSFCFNHEHLTERDMVKLIRLMKVYGVVIDEVPDLPEIHMDGVTYTNYASLPFFGVDPAGETMFQDHLAPFVNGSVGCHIFPDKTPVDNILDYIRAAWGAQGSRGLGNGN